MPQSFGTRSERRQFSRDASRHFATTRLRQPDTAPDSIGPKRTTRAERRKQGWRGDISALVHGPHDTAWLYSGTLNASGQARINHKRNQRAEFWASFQRQGELGDALNRRIQEHNAEAGHADFWRTVRKPIPAPEGTR